MSVGLNAERSLSPSQRKYEIMVRIREKNILIFPSQPLQRIDNELILYYIFKGEGQFLISIVFVINVIMTHINIDHLLFLMGANNRVIAAMPYHSSPDFTI